MFARRTRGFTTQNSLIHSTGDPKHRRKARRELVMSVLELQTKDMFDACSEIGLFGFFRTMYPFFASFSVTRPLIRHMLTRSEMLGGAQARKRGNGNCDPQSTSRRGGVPRRRQRQPTRSKARMLKSSRKRPKKETKTTVKSSVFGTILIFFYSPNLRFRAVALLCGNLWRRRRLLSPQ
jgi:hypothetical protein